MSLELEERPSVPEDNGRGAPEPLHAVLADPARVFTPAIVQRIAAHLSATDVACLRYINKATASEFSHHVAMRLSQPAATWAFTQHWTAPGACRSLTRGQLYSLIGLAAASNVVPNLEVALAVLAAAGLPPRLDELLTAAGAGALDSCIYLADHLEEQGQVRWCHPLGAAAKRGHRSICEWCLDRCPALDAAAVWQAAAEALRGGHLALAEWLLSQRAEVGPSGAEELALCVAALEGCDLATAQRLAGRFAQPQRWNPDESDYGCLHPLSRMLGAALVSRTADWAAKAEWVSGLAVEPPRSWGGAVFGAIARSVVEPWARERFTWLTGKGFKMEWPDARYVLCQALETGNVVTAEWVLAEGDESLRAKGTRTKGADRVKSVYRATLKGHLSALRVLQRAGTEWFDPAERVARGAAEGGHLAVLRWAVEELPSPPGEVLTPELFAAAARGGSCEALTWLRRERGCGMSGEAWRAAVESGCEAAVELLAELGCPLPEDSGAFDVAILLADWRMLPVLRRAGLPCHAGLLAAAVAAGAPQEALQWLDVEGGPLPGTQ